MKKDSKQLLFEMMGRLNPDFKLREVENNRQIFDAIGFANQYYTLWHVVIDGDFTTYEYLRNLSHDFEAAKQKAGTDYFVETLKGKTRSFGTLKFDNGDEWEMPEDKYLQFVDAVFPFGKYAGVKIIDIVNKDPKYLAWATGVIKNEKLKRLIEFLPPVQKELQNDPKYKREKELVANNLTSGIDLIKSKLVQDGFSDNVKVIKDIATSETIVFEAMISTIILNKSFAVKGKNLYYKELPIGNSGKKYRCYMPESKVFGRIPAIDVSNVDLTKYGTPIKAMSGTVAYYQPNDTLKSEMSNRQYKITGNFKFNVKNVNLEKIEYDIPNFFVIKVELI